MEIEPLARATKSILHFVLPRGFATLENAIRNKQYWYEQQEDWNQRFRDRWTRGKHVERSQNQQSAQKCEVKGGERLGLLRAAWSYCRAGCSGLLQRALGCSGPEVAFERIT